MWALTSNLFTFWFIVHNFFIIPNSYMQMAPSFFKIFLNPSSTYLVSSSSSSSSSHNPSVFPLFFLLTKSLNFAEITTCFHHHAFKQQNPKKPNNPICKWTVLLEIKDQKNRWKLLFCEWMEECGWWYKVGFRGFVVV